MRDRNRSRPAVALLLALVGACSAPVPLLRPPPCPEPPAAPSTSAVATALAAPPEHGSRPPDPPSPAGFDFNPSQPASRTIALEKITSLAAPDERTLSAVARPDGSAWLTPSTVAAKGSLLLLSTSGSLTKPWTSPRRAQLLSAAAGGGGLWVAASPLPSSEVFAFPHLERVFRLDRDGRIAVDSPFRAGVFRAFAVASNGAGPLWLAGTIAGSLQAGKDTLSAPHDGRADALVQVGPGGAVEWGLPLPDAASGSVSALAVSADGTALAVAKRKGSADALLFSVGPDGALRWKKTVSSTASAGAVAMAIEHVAPDGAGGLLVAGTVPGGEGYDFGKGVLVGKGRFVARLGPSGDPIWVRAFDDVWQLVVNDGVVLAVLRHGDERGVIHEFDASAAWKRTVDFQLPQPCRTSLPAATDDNAPSPLSGSAELSLGVTARHLVVAVICQQFHHRYQQPEPVGKPVLYAGHMERS